MTSAVIWQYRHYPGSWITTSPVIWQYRDMILVAGYCHFTAEVPSSYPDNVAMQSYEDRNHNPATQIRSLYYHMTVEVSYTGYRCLHLTYKDGRFWLGVYYALNLNSKIIYLTTGDYTSQQALYQNKFTGSAILTTKCWWGSPKVWSNI
jgi:hypothetical protein